MVVAGHVKIDSTHMVQVSDDILRLLTDEFSREDGKIYAQDILPGMTLALARLVSGMKHCDADSVMKDLSAAIAKYGVFSFSD